MREIETRGVFVCDVCFGNVKCIEQRTELVTGRRTTFRSMRLVSSGMVTNCTILWSFD